LSRHFEDGLVARSGHHPDPLPGLAGRDRLRRAAVHDQQRLAAQHALQGDGLRHGSPGHQGQEEGEQPLHAIQSRKLLKDKGSSAISLRTNAMAACRSSFLVPVTRTASPWIAAWTFSLLSLISFCSLLAWS